MKMTKQEYAAIVQAWADGKELQFLDDAGDWTDRSDSDDFPLLSVVKYRVKPEVILVNGIEVPKPFDGVLDNEQDYFLVETFDSEYGVTACDNINMSTGELHVRSGMVHLALSSAELHAKALNTKPEPKVLVHEVVSNISSTSKLSYFLYPKESEPANLRLSFDEVTGKLLSAEVI